MSEDKTKLKRLLDSGDAEKAELVVQILEDIQAAADSAAVSFNQAVTAQSAYRQSLLDDAKRVVEALENEKVLKEEMDAAEDKRRQLDRAWRTESNATKKLAAKAELEIHKNRIANLEALHKVQKDLHDTSGRGYSQYLEDAKKQKKPQISYWAPEQNRRQLKKSFKTLAKKLQRSTESKKTSFNFSKGLFKDQFKQAASGGMNLNSLELILLQ